MNFLVKSYYKEQAVQRMAYSMSGSLPSLPFTHKGVIKKPKRKEKEKWQEKEWYHEQSKQSMLK